LVVLLRGAGLALVPHRVREPGPEEVSQQAFLIARRP
jgi:hypothetical protein